MSGPVTIRIQEDDFDIAREIAGLIQGRADIGAVVTFSGICRANEDSAKISALTLEHYPGMAEEEIERLTRASEHSETPHFRGDD